LNSTFFHYYFLTIKMISNNETKQIQVQGQATGLAKAISKEFDGHKIRIDSQKQMLCASDMCKVNPKKLWADYKRNKDTKEFIGELGAVMGIPISGLIHTIKGGNDKHTQGTWIHIKIAMDLARWISPKFALFVYDIFGRFLAGDLTLAHDLVRNANQNGTINNVSVATNPKTKEIVAIAKTYTNGCLEAQVEFEILKDRYDEMNGTLKKKDVEISDLKKLLIEGDKKADDERKKADDERKKADDERKKADERHKEQTAQIQMLLGYGVETKDSLKKQTEQNDELLEQNDNLHETVENVEQKVTVLDKRLDEVLPRCVLMEKVKKENHPFIVLVRDKGADEGDYDLYVMRCQEKSIKSTLRRLSRKYGEELIISKRIKQPNAVAFWETIRKKHRWNIIDSNSNWFRLISITHTEFFASIETMDKERQKK